MNTSGGKLGLEGTGSSNGKWAERARTLLPNFLSGSKNKSRKNVDLQVTILAVTEFLNIKLSRDIFAAAGCTPVKIHSDFKYTQ